MQTVSSIPESLKPDPTRAGWYLSAMEHLVEVVQALSQARDLDAITAIVRCAARELTGADGATFVLRDGNKCFYAEENAISPLWKGQRFPMDICVSGWVMRNGHPAVIEDIYKDPRVPYDAYRPTFVKSMVMVPIRAENPIGAIGNYWAHIRMPSLEELDILKALANVTSVAMENVDLYEQLQGKIKALENSNYELGRFAWIASHDLKSPLRAIDRLSQWIEEDQAGYMKKDSANHMRIMRQRVRRMEKLLDDILEFSHLEQTAGMAGGDMVDGGMLIKDLELLIDLPPGFTLRTTEALRKAQVARMPLERVLSNLINNGIAHHDRPEGTITVDVEDGETQYVFMVHDDGPGIPKEYHEKIFEMFQTLQSRDVTEGSGMGLAIVKKIVTIFGGQITVESGSGRGATFRFTWPKYPEIGEKQE